MIEQAPTRSRFNRPSVFVVIALILLPLLAACGNAARGENAPHNQQTEVAERNDVYNRADALYPPYIPVNFPMRAALVDFVQRQDQVNHPWYVYLMGQNGTYIGYYVGKTYPINACNFLSSSQRVSNPNSSGGNVVLDSPSLDGMYYGGGGTSGSCTAMFMFDIETNAMIVFDVPAYFASDVPLDINVPKLSVSSTGAPPTPEIPATAATPAA